MLKSCKAILLLLLLSFHFLAQLGILMNFSINQDYIAKVLCINKDKPQMQCNGKCHLAKQLKQVEDAENTNFPSQQKNKPLEAPIFILHENQVAFLTSSIKEERLKMPSKPNWYQYQTISGVFHPPC